MLEIVFLKTQKLNIFFWVMPKTSLVNILGLHHWADVAKRHFGPYVIRMQEKYRTEMKRECEIRKR